MGTDSITYQEIGFIKKFIEEKIKIIVPIDRVAFKDMDIHSFTHKAHHVSESLTIQVSNRQTLTFK